LLLKWDKRRVGYHMSETFIIDNLPKIPEEFVVERDPFLVRREKALAAQKIMQVGDVMWVAVPNHLPRGAPINWAGMSEEERSSARARRDDPSMTAEVRDSTILPPPEPRDPKGTRPALDLVHLARQVRGIQQFVVGEMERKRQGKVANQKGEEK
jgi:hypothetical protein